MTAHLLDYQIIYYNVHMLISF